MRVPLLGMFAGSMLAGGCFVHGLAGIYIMMGPADAVRLLGIDSPDRRMSLSVISSIPLVPVALALSRFSVADGVLPVLPMIYLMGRQRPTKSGPLWPPSMMMTLCALPYIRSLYNGFHKKVISPKEKAWLKEIQPRGGEDSEENPINDDAAQPAPEVHDIVNDEDGMDFELGVQVEVIEEEEGVGQLQPDNAAAQIQPPNDNDDQNQAPQPRPDIDQAAPALAPNQPAPLGPHAHHFQRNIQIDVGAIMNAVIGAMLFPTISAFMGGVLYGIVPSRFTAPPRSHWLHGPARQTGLLQSRWGRSLVGGLLFVVLKDALVFWTRWSMKEDHKQRKVLNHWEKEEDVASERKGGAWWRRFWR